MANANFNLNIKTNVDSAELSKLKQQLQEIRNLAMNVDFTGDLSPKEIQAMTAAAHNLEKALDAAFDPDLNTVNIQKFNQYLNKTGLNIRDLQADLALAGVTGQQAFVNATTSLLKMGTAAKQTSKFLDDIVTSFGNTVRWSIMSSIVNNISSTIQQSYHYVKDLDSGLNDIRIVTGKSADEMERFAESANNAAKALAVSTNDYVEGSLIYYQQGLDDETVKTLTDITAKTSNVTGQSMEAISEQLTAVWNGYQVANQAAKEGMGVYQEYVDKMAAVGATTASNLEELATAMSKVASAANAMGVDFDQLSAQIATIVSVTRQAPESVGTALKTIYARIGDLKIDGVDEFGVTLGDVSGQLEQVGIKIMDQSGNLREVGPIMEEVASKWNTWNEAQQQSIAIAIAGKRQYNNLLALFENWDMYTETLNTAANAAGTLDEQQSIALESLENKLEKLSTTVEDLYDSLLDEEGLKDLVDAITPFVQGLADAADAIGGLKNLLPLLGSLGVQVFNKQLTQSVLRLSDNLRKSAKNAQLNYQELSNLSGVLNIDAVDDKGDSADVVNSGIQELKRYYEEIYQYKKYMTTEDENQYNLILKQKGEIINSNIALEEQVESWKRAQEFASNRSGNSFTTKISGIDKVEDFKKLEKAVQEYNNGLTGLIDIQSKVTVSGMDNISIINTMSDAFDAAFSGTDVDIQGFKNEFNQLNQALENNEINVTEYDNALVELFDRMKNFPNESVNLINTFNNIKRKIDNLGDSTDIFKQKLELTKTISQITSTVSAIGQLASAIQMFKNIGDIWSNENLTDSEKMLQTFINLTSVAGVAANAIVSLNNVTGLSAVISAKKNIATLTEIEATKSLTEEEKKLLALETKRLALNKTKLIIFAAVAVAVALIGAAYTSYRKSLADNTKEAKKNLEAQKEVIEVAKEQKNAVDNLAQSYESLATQYENNELTLEELRNKTYALCLEYNQQDLALKTLIADYEQLNNIINQAQIEKSKEFQKSAKEGLKQNKKVISASLAEQGGIIDNFGETIDIRNDIELAALSQDEFGLERDNEDYSALIKVLSKYGITNFKNGHIQVGEFAQAISDNYDELYKDLEELGSSEAKQLIELMETQKENVKTSQEYNNQIVSTQKDILSAQYSGKATSLSDYRQKMSNLAQTELDGIKLFDTQKQANEWAEGQLIKDSANAQFAIDNAIAEVYSEKTGLTIEDNLKEIEAEIAKFNNSEKGFIYLYLDAAMAEDSLEDFVKKYDIYAESLNKKATSITAKSFIGSEKALTKSELDVLYAEGSDFGNTIDRDSFSKLSAGSQQFYLVKYYSEYQKYLEENKDEIIKETQELQQSLQDSIDAIEDNANFKKFSENEDLKTYLKDTSYTMEDLNTAAKVVASEGMEGLTESQKELVDGLKEKGLVTEDDLKTTGALLNEYDEYQKQLESATAAVIEATNAEGDWIGALQKVEKAQDVNSKLIDDLQSGYKSLSSIVEDYNKTGTFTLDNYQALLNLSPEMLSALEFEGGQMSINKERIKELAKMRIEEAKALVIEQTQTGLQAIMEGKAAEAGIALTSTNIALAASTGEASEAALAGAESWLTYASSLVDAATATEIMNNPDAVAFLENQRKLLLGLDKIDLDKNFEYTMGASSMQEAKKLEDEVDRYWELNKALEEVSETISDLDKRQSHLHGKELINSLKQENELLEEQANRYKAINAEQMREANELRQKLASTYAVSFDANGGIANYAEATTRMLNWYNNNLDDEVAQKSYDNFKKLLERYETLYYEEMVDVQNQLDDIFYQQLENNLKAWETDLEINLELEEAEREWSDFTKAMQDDFKKVYKDINRDFANIMEKISSYGDDGTINLDIQAIQDVVREIEKLEAGGMSNIFVSISEAQEKLKELQGTLMDDAEAAHDLWIEAWEAYLEGIDQAADKFDDLMDKFDNINEELEYQKELVELLYGDEAYDIYAKLYDSQLNNSMTQIKSIKDQIALWQEFYDNAEEGSEEQLKYYELLQDAQSELNDLKLSHIKLLQEERNNTINQAMDALDKSLTGGLGIDKMKEQWEDAKWYADRYLDDVEKIYSLESLANDFNKAIINAGTLEQQQELKELQEQELAILKAKAHTTEYDYEFARKKLALKEAEIALENAQNAKDSMKLVRGANGDWEYQYVTDEEDVFDKQQQLLESYQALYDLAQNAKEKAMETAMDLREQMVAEAKQLAIEYQGDQEGLQKALEELHDEYYNPENGKISLIMGDYAQYEQDLNQALEIAINGSYENIKTGLENVTRENLGIWTEATQNMADAWNADDGESVRSQVLQAMEDILQANQDYEDKVNELAGVVEEDFSEDGIKGAIDDATDATNNLEDATSDLCDTARSELTSYREYVNQVEEAWNKVYDAAYRALQMSKQAAAAAGKDVSYSGGNSSESGTQGVFNPGDRKNNTVKDSDPEPEVPTPAGWSGPKWLAGTMLMVSPNGNSKYKASGTYWYKDHSDTFTEGTPYPIEIMTRSGKTGYISKSVAGLKSGGYTGEWTGGEGRLAFLHEKELVLNAKDTKNILDTVNTIRDLGNVTSSIGSAIINTIKAMAMEVLGIKAGANYNTQQANTSTNNTFEIYAEFPNANDVTSIKEAILSLPNLASQYTSQNKK